MITTTTQTLRQKTQQMNVNAVKRRLSTAVVFIESMMLSAMNVYAAASDPKGVLMTIMDKVIDLFPLIGVVIAAVGAFKLFMAFRNDQPDAYSGAVKDIVIGAALIVFKTFLWNTIRGLV